MASDPPKVLISYSHKDNQYGNDLETHLEPYLQEGSLTSWSDKQIQPGSQGPDALSGLGGAGKIQTAVVFR